MHGILLIDKPKGWTSFDVVAKVRGIIRQTTDQKKPKVGHTGTLDPLATGLLVLTLGSFCKKAQQYSKLDKVYDAVICIGQTSTTGDDEGQKTHVSDAQPEAKQLESAIKSLTGVIEQTPPAYSAVKIGGQRAYKLARSGVKVELEPRKATVYEAKLSSYRYPLAELRFKVSSGTYIRSLAEDIGKVLGTGAYIKELRRVSVGGFNIDQAEKVEKLSPELIQNRIILPAEQ